MNRKARVFAAIAAIVVLGGGAAALSLARARQSPVGTQPEHEHEEPGHHEDGHEEHGSEDALGHNDHDEHDDHDDHGEQAVVQLSLDERTKFGVKVATAGPGQLTTQIRLPGELVLNADRVAHIVPRAPGIVREVLACVGAAVHAGEVMAWLESSELGEAKVDYLGKWAKLGCCTVDLTRAQEVHDNTLQLLEVLKTSPSLETLRDMNGSAMGENRSILISAYAEFVFAESAYLRERLLFEKKIASERDYQATEAEYKKADALYAATRDSIDFKIRRELLEAKRVQRVRDIELKGARRRLYVLGLSSEEIAEVELLAPFQTAPRAQKAECTDPNCKNCKQHGAGAGSQGGTDLHEIEEKLAWYPLRAPFDGRVIEKHLTLGEKLSDDSDAFTIADLSSVWADLAVYQKDLSHVKKGMNVSISAGAGMPKANGVIAYMAPIVDEATRTALARVVLANPNGDWRPGLFVNAEISIGQKSAPVVIPKSAVQRIGETPVVFLDTSAGFKPVPVSLGRSNTTYVEVSAGLAVGQRYVTQGAFELKAKIVTSGLGAHAGHGH